MHVEDIVVSGREKRQTALLSQTSSFFNVAGNMHSLPEAHRTVLVHFSCCYADPPPLHTQEYSVSVQGELYTNNPSSHKHLHTHAVVNMQRIMGN